MAAAGHCAVAATATTGSAIWLFANYRPTGVVPFGTPSRLADPDLVQRWNESILTWWLWAAVILVVAVSAAAVRRRSAPPFPVVVGAASTLVSAAVAVWTRPAVQWDQLALWAVDPRTDLDGYGAPILGEGVRFVLVEGTEISIGTYTGSLVIHFGAMALGALASGMVGWTLWRSSRERSGDSEAQVDDATFAGSP